MIGASEVCQVLGAACDVQSDRLAYVACAGDYELERRDAGRRQRIDCAAAAACDSAKHAAQYEQEEQTSGTGQKLSPFVTDEGGGQDSGEPQEGSGQHERAAGCERLTLVWINGRGARRCFDSHVYIGCTAALANVDRLRLEGAGGAWGWALAGHLKLSGVTSEWRQSECDGVGCCYSKRNLES